MNIASLFNMKELFANKETRRFIRFVTVGVINTLVDFAFFTLCVGVFKIDYTIGQVVGYSAGVLNSFVFNKFWTFENNEVNSKTTQQFIQFVVVNLISLGLTVLALRVIVGDWNINKYIAKLMVTVFAQLINYFGYRLWVFKKNVK